MCFRKEAFASSKHWPATNPSACWHDSLTSRRTHLIEIHFIMRKIFLTAFAACALVSCTDNQTEETTTTETMHVEDNGTMAGARIPAEGDVTYNGRTVQVYRGSTWEDANDD